MFRVIFVDKGKNSTKNLSAPQKTNFKKILPTLFRKKQSGSES
jgi:hypothetical protein